jgi:pimeloyl-ACP methyl ester carboxylesterase
MKLRSPLLFLPLLLALAACAPFTQYRDQYNLCVNKQPALTADCEKHALQQVPVNGNNYLLGFIEFDDQGQLWDRKQMRAVLDRFSTEAANQELLMVVFVHGWKHSAAPGDGNIETFRQVLGKLSEGETQISRQTGRPARRVAGVYLGWRGGSVTVPWVENITFWERKNTAQKVGHGGVTEVLARLEQLKRDKESIQAGRSNTRLVVVGHSFGGAVVHTALAQILEGRFVRTRGPDGSQTDVEGFGNLVVLINPAFEARQFATLSDMASERGSYFKSQLPVIAILTSEADYATRYAFPAGRQLSTLWEKTRDTPRWNAVTKSEEIISEGDANLRAIGHFQPYRTHRLYPNKIVQRAAIPSLSSQASLKAALQAANAWENDQPGSKIAFADLTLERTATSAGRNPYLLTYVDKQLIHDHNDIDDERIIEFVKQLILISTLSEESKGAINKALQAVP